MATPALQPEQKASNGNVAKLTLNLKDVLFLLVLIAGLVANWSTTAGKVQALQDQMQDMKQDIRELRNWIEKHP